VYPSHTVLAAAMTATPRIKINQSLFHQIPAYMLVVIACAVAIVIIQRLGPRVNRLSGRKGAHADLALDVAQLSSAAALAVAISVTPGGNQLLGIVQNLETGIAAGVAGTFLHLSAGVILFLLPIGLGWWYINDESWWLAIAFGMSMITLAATSNLAADILSWSVNDLVRFIWNGFLAVAGWVFRVV
jgi:hypothetical protein